MSKSYPTEYINNACRSQQIPTPDANQAGKDLEVLQAVYEGHRLGGAVGAQAAWSALKKTHPHLDKKPRKIHADDLHTIRIPEHAVDGYAVYDKGVNLLIGTRGAGKTFVALDIACRMAIKHPDQAVIYSTGEALPVFYPRYLAWKKHYNLHPRNLYFWDGAVQPHNLLDVSELKADFMADKPCFLVVDTVTRSMAGLNENDTAVMSQYSKSMEDLGNELNCGVLLVHHEGRNGMQRGSSVLDANMESVIAVKRDGQLLIMYNDLEHGGKNRHRREEEPQTLEFLSVEISINGNPHTSAVIVQAPEAEEDESDYTPKQMSILEVIDAHGELSPADLVSATGISKSSLYRHLTPLVKRKVIYLDKQTGVYRFTQYEQPSNVVRMKS